MKVYLVGGAVRDELLGLPIKERDWVIVGGTPEELLAVGFQPVGKDFPVFLHPDTHEEYALARTERKVAKGYKGFEFYASPEVTLEQDLQRRDLTVNAMAYDESNHVIDPFNGQQDLKQKVLRHVSLAFAEDPVRILRAARFATKLPEFKVADETNQLMQQMVQQGEVDALVAERVWKELSRALEEAAPQRFFEVLTDCNALEKLFPEIKLQGAGMKALQNALEQTQDGTIRFAALTFDIKPHVLKLLCQRYRIPKHYAQLAMLVSEWHHAYETSLQANAEEILILLKKTDALRRGERFKKFMQACTACLDVDHSKIKNYLLKTLDAIKSIDVSLLTARKLQGKAFAKALHQMQLDAIKKVER